jgi:type IV pilus assembly protein PilQ
MNVLSSRGSVVDFKLTNKVTVQDIPANIAKIDRIVLEQDIPTRQVMIEAKIIQSNPSYVKELGIRWGGTYATTHNKDAITVSGGAGGDNIVNLPAAAGLGSGGAVNFGYIKDNLTLNTQLSALEQEDKLKILSNPRVLGLDNNEARIKQGVALPYLKLSDQGVTSTEFKDAVLELTVTPKITAANTIALNVYVTKNQRSAQTGAGGEPGIDVREVETYLLVKSGETVVIGGIYETTKSLTINKVPFFGNLPLLGRAFRYQKEEDQLTELLIFITVNVVDNPGLMAQASDTPGNAVQ